MDTPHPTDERIVLSVIEHENTKEIIRGNDGLGHENLASHLNYEITAAAWFDGDKMVDITDFINEHCPHLFQKWENQLAAESLLS